MSVVQKKIELLKIVIYLPLFLYFLIIKYDNIGIIKNRVYFVDFIFLLYRYTIGLARSIWIGSGWLALIFIGLDLVS